MAEERRWTLDLILSVLGYCTTHNRFATLTPDEVIAECVKLFTDLDGPGSPYFQETDECEHLDYAFIPSDDVAVGDGYEGVDFRYCPRCGARLSQEEEK